MTGSQITTIRENAGLTQVQFAQRLGIHPVTLSRFENDRDPIPLTIELAVCELKRRLGVDPPMVKAPRKPKK